MNARAVCIAVWSAFALQGVPGIAGAAGCNAESGARRVPLIELYTSEGCDSCPPADRWLATVAAEAFRDGRAVPLALHVDYWDHLGWRDPYASAQFTQRQRASAQRAASRVVYTPQVQINGRDFRGWRDRSTFQRALDAGSGPAQVRIRLAAARDGERDWAVTITADASGSGARGAGLYLALAGENRGATLGHEFVVREWLGPLPLDPGGRLQETRVLPARDGIDYARAGLVAFVQDAGGLFVESERFR